MFLLIMDTNTGEGKETPCPDSHWRIETDKDDVSRFYIGKSSKDPFWKGIIVDCKYMENRVMIAIQPIDN